MGPGVSLASFSDWADDVRQERPQTYNWHFVNIPLETPSYNAARDCRPDPERGDCIIAAVGRLRAQLTNPHAAGQANREALKYLVHFIADLHQPLHTIREDHGGNDRAVRFFAGPGSGSASAPKQDTNLHAFWDGGLIRHCARSWDAYVAHLQYDWLPGRDIDALSRGTVIEWAEEAHRAAKEIVTSVPPNADLGDQYVERALPVLDRQLTVAGLRLARVLNEAFGSSPHPYAATLPQETSAGWLCK
jgi:nuclease S1